MTIKWSDEDDCFLVLLPEFDGITHGETYEKAAREGRLLIESYVMWYQQDGKELPVPRLYDESKDRVPVVKSTPASRHGKVSTRFLNEETPVHVTA